MFSTATDASKVALAHLVARLRWGGFELLDCQFITPHLASLGAIEITRKAYLARLENAVSPDRPEGDYRAFDSSVSPSEALMSPPRTTVVSGPISGCRILQSLAQTS
jgi:leucyl/phenylalanyl-tRNA---protein transferase